MKEEITKKSKKPKKSKNILKLIGILLLFFFSSLMQLIIIPILGYDLHNLTAHQNLILTAFSDSILLIILGLIYSKTLKNDFKKLREKGKFYRIIEEGFKYWLLGLIVMMVSNVIIGILTPAHAGNEESVQELIHSTKILSIIIIGIIAPIIEELVFRKSFRDVFKNNWVFIIVSGLVFGGLHVVLSMSSAWDLLYIIPYSSLGMAFAYMYCKTDNIYTSMFMHMFHNTVLTTISVIGIGAILW